MAGDNDGVKEINISQNKKNFMQVMTNDLTLYVRLLFLVFFLGALWFLYHIVNPKAEVTLSVYTNLMSEREDDSLITSSGQMGNYVFWVREEDQNKLSAQIRNSEMFKRLVDGTYWKDFSYVQALDYKEGGWVKNVYRTILNNKTHGMVKNGALCTYEIDFTVGYDAAQKGKTIAWFMNPDSNISELSYPDVFSVNLNKAGRDSLKQDEKLVESCKAYLFGKPTDNVRGTKLAKSRVRQWLKEDGVWLAHMKQGLTQIAYAANTQLYLCKASSNKELCKHNAKATDVTIRKNLEEALKQVEEKTIEPAKLDRLRPRKTQTFAWRKPKVEQANAFSLVPNAYADISINTSFLATFSTMATVSMTKRRFIVGKDDEYAFRRDMAEVYYGAPMPDINNISIFSADKYISQIEEPSVVAINRWTDDFGVAYDGKLNELTNRNNLDQKSLEEFLNDEILQSLDAAIARNHNHAVAMAKDYFRNRYGTEKTIISFTKPKEKSLLNFKDY